MYSIESILMEVTNVCNFNCDHCYKGDVNNKEDISFTNIKRIIDEAKKIETKHIIFSGGEVFLYDKIIDLLDLCIFTPDFKFTFATNGSVLTEELIHKISKADNITIQISVDGYKKNTYERQRGSNTFEAFRKGYFLLSNSNIKRTTRTCITQYNYNEIEYIFLDSIEHGYLPSFVFVTREGRANDNWEKLSLSPVEKIKIYELITSLNQKYNIPNTLSACSYGCFLYNNQPLDAINIKSNGDIFCCQKLYNYPIANINQNKLIEVFDSIRLKELYIIAQEHYNNMKKSEICMNCKLNGYCFYGCPSEVLNQNNIIDRYSDCSNRKAFFLYNFLKEQNRNN